VIVLYAPAVIYSAGFAGALDSGLKVGDMIQPARVVNASDGSSTSLDHGEGVLVSFNSVATPAQKAKLRESFCAQAVDMEAAAVARAAEARRIKFAVVKVISDESDFDFPATDRFVDAIGQFSETRFAVFVALRPWLWLQVIRLASNSNRAAAALSRWFREHLHQIAHSAEPTSDPRALEAVNRPS
jgi:nucleoside phosphorylase